MSFHGSLTYVPTLQVVPRNFVRSRSYTRTGVRGKWLQCFPTFAIYIYGVKPRTKISPRKFISYHSFLPFPSLPARPLIHFHSRPILLTRCSSLVFLPHRDASKKYFRDTWRKKGRENNTICGIPYVWRADESRFSAYLIFIGRPSSS